MLGCLKLTLIMFNFGIFRYLSYFFSLFEEGIMNQGNKEKLWALIIYSSPYLGDIIVVNTNWWFHSTSVLEDLSITITNEYVDPDDKN